MSKRDKQKFRELRAKLFSEQHGECWYCEIKMCLPVDDHETDGDIATLDHIIPRSQGGRNVAENFLAACRACNSRRGSKPAAAFRWQLRKKLAREARPSAHPVKQGEGRAA